MCTSSNCILQAANVACLSDWFQFAAVVDAERLLGVRGMSLHSVWELFFVYELHFVVQ